MREEAVAGREGHHPKYATGMELFLKALRPFPETLAGAEDLIGQFVNSRRRSEDCEALAKAVGEVVWPIRKTRLRFIIWIQDLAQICGFVASEAFTEEEKCTFRDALFQWESATWPLHSDENGKLLDCSHLTIQELHPAIGELMRRVDDSYLTEFQQLNWWETCPSLRAPTCLCAPDRSCLTATDRVCPCVQQRASDGQ